MSTDIATPAHQALNDLFIEFMSLPSTTVIIKQLIENVTGKKSDAVSQQTRVEPADSKHVGQSTLIVPPIDVRLIASSPPRSPARSFGSPKYGDVMSPSSRRSPLPVRKFFFPEGAPPVSPTTQQKGMDIIRKIFEFQPDKKLRQDDFYVVTSHVCGLPSYANSALYQRVVSFARSQSSSTTTTTTTTTTTLSASSPKSLEEADNKDGGAAEMDGVTEETFTAFWRAELERFDPIARLFRILRRPPNNFLTRADFQPIVTELVNRHPGLEFLEATPEFQLRYAQTVVARIFYHVNKTGNDRMTLKELQKSNLFQIMHQLDQEEDINKLNDYFSYEHFYVIYCKFWELDADHDFLIDASDLQRYNDYALTGRMVERVMSGACRRLLSGVPGKMGYDDFVVFLISEVDKTNEVSLDYWFKAVDLDGDGVIDAYDMEYFFSEQQQRMQALNQEHVQFDDILCQLVDMIKPESGTSRITKKDLLKCQLFGPFFNILFNLGKFLAYEQRDPQRIRQQRMNPHLTEWDRYAIAGYFHLAEADMGNADQGVADGDGWGDEHSSVTSPPDSPTREEASDGDSLSHSAFASSESKSSLYGDGNSGMDDEDEDEDEDEYDEEFSGEADEDMKKAGGAGKEAAAGAGGKGLRSRSKRTRKLSDEITSDEDDFDSGADDRPASTAKP